MTAFIISSASKLKRGDKVQVIELKQEICFQVFADDIVNNLVAGNSVLRSHPAERRKLRVCNSPSYCSGLTDVYISKEME